MLVMRYFLFVGGALFALLLACGALLPKPAATEGTVASASDAPAIRIHSQRKWPDRIVLDTNAPMPASTAQLDKPVILPPDAAAKARTSEALAQLPADEAKEAKQVAAQPKKPKLPPKRRFARVRVAPPPVYGGYPSYQYPSYSRMMVAQQPHFGFFW
jgi:hypothetical protein